MTTNHFPEEPAREPLTLDELASPMVGGAPDDVDEIEAEWMQLPEYEAALADLRRQLSEQRARGADLQREAAELEAYLAHWRRLDKLRRTKNFFQQIARRAVAKNPFSIRRLKAKLEYIRREQIARIAQVAEKLEYVRTEDREQITRIAETAHLVANYETRIVEDRERFDGQPLTKLARSYRRDPWWPELQSVRRISMLHPETLYLLRCCAARVRNAIVEVGPYIGGSTIALGRGLQLGGAGPLISVEMGGSYPSHAVPTDDIIRDLKRNVEAYGLTGLVHIMEGFTTDPEIDATVNRVLSGRPIDLLFLDADGNVERDFELYRGRLNRGAILVYDDYLTEGAPEKQTTIKAWVDSAVVSGLVENLGVYRWGTWVGRYWG